MLMVRVRARPSRPKPISMPILRKKVAARRSRPASARGPSGQNLDLATRSPRPLQGRPEGSRQFPSTPSALPSRRARRWRSGRRRSRPPPPRRDCHNRPTRRCRRATAPSRTPSPTARNPPCAAASPAGLRKALEALHHGVEQHTKDPRALRVERGPEFLLRAAAFFRDRLQRQEHGAVGKVGPGDDLLDAVEDHRPRGVEQHLILVAVELAHSKATAGCQPAKRVGNPPRQARHVVEGQYMTIAGGDE